MPENDRPQQVSTASTHAARDHARSQAGTQTRFQRTIPAPSATRAPDHVDPQDVLWEETVRGGNYSTGVLPRGARLRLSDPEGDTCVQLLVFNRQQPSERLNIADTVKVQWQAYLSAGQLLLSDMGRVLVSFESDNSAGHDAFNSISNLEWNRRKYGAGRVSGPHPNARDQFAVALTKVGLGRRDIAPAINLFKPTRIDGDGNFVWPAEPNPKGAEVVVRAEMEIRVVLTVTPHVLDPRPNYKVSPVELTAWRGPVTAPDDTIRLRTPEAQRAFENTEDWLASQIRQNRSDASL